MRRRLNSLGPARRLLPLTGGQNLRYPGSDCKPRFAQRLGLWNSLPRKVGAYGVLNPLASCQAVVVQQGSDQIFKMHSVTPKDPRRRNAPSAPDREPNDVRSA